MSDVPEFVSKTLSKVKSTLNSYFIEVVAIEKKLNNVETENKAHYTKIVDEIQQVLDEMEKFTQEVKNGFRPEIDSWKSENINDISTSSEITVRNENVLSDVPTTKDHNSNKLDSTNTQLSENNNSELTVQENLQPVIKLIPISKLVDPSQGGFTVSSESENDVNSKSNKNNKIKNSKQNKVHSKNINTKEKMANSVTKESCNTRRNKPVRLAVLKAKTIILNSDSSGSHSSDSDSEKSLKKSETKRNLIKKNLNFKKFNGASSDVETNKLKRGAINEDNKKIHKSKEIITLDTSSSSSNSSRSTSPNNVSSALKKQKTKVKKRDYRSRSKIADSDSSRSSSKSELSTRNKRTSNEKENLSDSSESSTSIVQNKNQNNKTKKVDIENDEKFKMKCRISLPKVTCENLIEAYLAEKEKTENAEILRLSNLKTLERRQKNIRRSSTSSSSSEVIVKERTRPRKKKKNKKTVHSSTASEGEQSTEKEPNILDEFLSTQNKSEDLPTNIINELIDNINVETSKSIHSPASNHSNTEENKEEESLVDKERFETSEQIIDETVLEDKDKMKSDEEDNKSDISTKANTDKLLTNCENIIVSDSDSDSKANDKEDSDEISSSIKSIKNRKKRKRIKVVLNSSDSEVSEKENNSEKENKSEKESESESEDEKGKQKANDSSSSESEPEKDEKKTKTTKRRRIRKVHSSDDSDGSGKDKKTRKKIKRMITKDELADTTKEAAKAEHERKARILERQKKYNNLFDFDPETKSRVENVVLDFDEETNAELLKVDDTIVKKLKPHQAKGVQFMWDACFESLKRAKETEGSGCILAHCMGLGKTLQVIALTHTLLANDENTGVKKVLVVCPLSTVLNWVYEYKKWLDDVEDSDELNVFDLVQFKNNSERLYQMKEWHKCGGILILGYDMFRNLANPNGKRMTKKMKASFQEILVDPGPDLIVCDEGHLLKNEKTAISVVINRLKTKRRIVLTGTPIQNNLKEYYCMIQFVKPNLLGTYKEYMNRFVNPITNGQYTDSTLHDQQIMRKRSHVLHKMLDGVVQRRDYGVLQPYLPPKHEYVLYLNLSDIQKTLYRVYMTEQSRRVTGAQNGRVSFLFVDFQALQRICTHPRVLLDKSIDDQNKREKEDLEEDSEGSLKDFIADSDASDTPSGSSSSSDSEDNTDTSSKPKQRATRSTRQNPVEVIEPEEINTGLKGDDEWWGKYCQGDELTNIIHSVKLSLLFDIIGKCEEIGDKLLVFSQSLYSLNTIEYFLSEVDTAAQTPPSDESDLVNGHKSSWALGLDYFRIDGSSSCDDRAAWCTAFNDENNPRARLFLISTRAGGLGINLVGANRVVIFDVSWNPSHDIQSIYRVYRFGQKKPCYVYRFVTQGTMEQKIYERQVTKQAISKRVVDEMQIDRHYNQNDLAELYKFEPEDPETRPIPLVPKDVLLGELLQNKKYVYKYHEHQSLLENKEEEELNEEERKAAWEEFESEKQNRALTTGHINHIPKTSISIALLSILKKDYPTLTEIELQQLLPHQMQMMQNEILGGNMATYNRVLVEIQLMQLHRLQQQQQEQNFNNWQNPMHRYYPTTGKRTELARQYELYYQQQRERQMAAAMAAAAAAGNNPFANQPQAAASNSANDIIDLND